MQTELISKSEYDELTTIQKEFPALTFQNKGYEGLDKTVFTAAEKAAFEKVKGILKRSVKGFSDFQNFRTNKKGGLEIRLQYNYNYHTDGLPFIGVGYILLDELVNGFNI